MKRAEHRLDEVLGLFARKTIVERLKEQIPKVVIITMLLLIPFIGVKGYWLDVLIRTNIFLVFTISLDFFSGTTFYLNLGHSFIIGLAAYLLALLNVYYGIPVEVGIPLSTLIACVLSLTLFLPSIRVKGVYFSIMSLLFPIIFTGIATTQPFSIFLGGEGGLRSKQLFLGLAKSLPVRHRLMFLQLSYYYLSLIVAVISYVVLHKLAYSDFGFTLRAIGQDEELAEVSGVDTFKVKLKGFLISSFFASLAGSFYASIKPPVTLDYVSVSAILMPVLTAMIVGGVGTITGPTIATYVLIILYEVLWGVVGEWRTIIYMSLLLVFVLLRPQGIAYYLYLKLKGVIRRLIKH